MTSVLTLSDLLTRTVMVEAHEAVAIVLEVADRILARDAAADGAPDLRQVQVSSAGRVTITGTVHGEPVRRLGQLLQALLAQSSPPVQLRLVISQATAPEPAYESIRDYTDALAYFARPDRAASILGLYARALESSELDQPGPALTLDAIAPLPHADGSSRAATGQAPDKVRPRSRRRLILIGAVAGLVVAGLVASQFGRSGRLLHRQQQVSSAVVSASDAIGTALVSGVSAVTERTGLGRIVPAREATVAPTHVELPTARSSRTARKLRRVVRAPVFRVFDLEFRPALSDGQDALPASSSDTVEGVSAANRHLHSAVGVDPATGPQHWTAADLTCVNLPDGTIYSSGSGGVAPPVGVRPQLPRELPSGIDMDTLARIDLVIAEDGTVQSVQLLGKRSTVRESMMLSAAKAWEFKPALKEGRPVKYRKTVWMVVE